MFSDFTQFSSGVQVAENKMTRLFDREHFSEGTKKNNLTKIHGSDDLFYFSEHFSEDAKAQFKKKSAMHDFRRKSMAEKILSSLKICKMKKKETQIYCNTKLLY